MIIRVWIYNETGYIGPNYNFSGLEERNSSCWMAYACDSLSEEVMVQGRVSTYEKEFSPQLRAISFPSIYHIRVTTSTSQLR